MRFEFFFSLHHRLGHHSNGVLEGLPFVAEPDANHFALVAQLMRQTGDFRT